MRRLSLAIALILSPLLGSGAIAQDGMAYVVSYIEVAPASSADTTKLLKQLRDASRKEAGAESFEVLQRSTHKNQFAVLETWKDAKAAEAHAGSAHVKQFREKLQPMLSAPYDERPHTGMAMAAGTAPAKGNIFAVTHVDIIPPKKDDGIAALKTLADPSRKDAGNQRYEVWQQNSRPNHFTLVETWKDMKAVEGHWTAAHMKAFREQLLPMSGSLYDERLYKAID